MKITIKALAKIFDRKLNPIKTGTINAKKYTLYTFIYWDNSSFTLQNMSYYYYIIS